jgi:hypothetical protein
LSTPSLTQPPSTTSVTSVASKFGCFFWQHSRRTIQHSPTSLPNYTQQFPDVGFQRRGTSSYLRHRRFPASHSAPSCASTIVALGPRPKALQTLFQIRCLPTSPPWSPASFDQSEATSLDAETQQLPYPQEQLNSYEGTHAFSGFSRQRLPAGKPTCKHTLFFPSLRRPQADHAPHLHSPPDRPSQNSHCTQTPADGKHCFPGRQQVISSTLRGHHLPGRPLPSFSPHLQGDCRSRFPWASHCRACGDQPNPAALRLRY